jgi:hypothetical protein
MSINQKQKYFDNCVKKPAGSRIHREMGQWQYGQYVHFKLLFVTKHRQDSENVLNDCYSKTGFTNFTKFLIRILLSFY